MDTETALLAAKQAASAAEAVIREHLTSGQWSVSVKPDNTPVTEVDMAAESVIRDILLDAAPEAAFFGEETGSSGNKNSQLLWLVDPIDGTKSFIRGLPYFSTQIALSVNGQLELGVSNAPVYGERLVALRDVGAWMNDSPVHSRADIVRIDDAFVSTGNLASLANDPAAWGRFGSLVSRARRVRGYGDFCHYHQLCSGQADLIIESDVNILDIAALTVAVRSAGGLITDLKGSAIDLSTSSVLAAANDTLHSQALELLNDH
ncbi:MAG: inositol monophosphatase [Granulosicoccus sp.]|nr:inositol monophosphatase [Granulosicoccus sp.]